MDQTLQSDLILADVVKFAFAFRIDIAIAVAGFVFAALLGCGLAALMAVRARPVRAILFVYLQAARGVPMFVLLYWVYFGLAAALALPLTSVQASLIALTLAGSGYTAEVLRIGLDAVDEGQFEAAGALGLNRRQLYWYIVLPQALRLVVPPLANIFIVMLQWATLLSVISVPDMLFVANQVMLLNFRPFEAYLAVALVMICSVSILSLLIALLERRLGESR